MTAEIAVVAIPLLGALVCWLLPRTRAGQFALTVVVTEEALVVLGSIRSILSSDVVPSARSAGFFALAVATLIVLVGLNGEGDDRTLHDRYPSVLAALAGVAVVALTNAQILTAALAISLSAIALAVTFVPLLEAGAPLRTARRYLIWVVLAGTALIASGALDRHYAAWATSGVLGPSAALFVVGIAIFAGAMPFALWLPAASDEAPTSVAFACGLQSCATAAILAGAVGSGVLLPVDSATHALLGVGGGLAALASAFIALGEKRPGRTIAFLISASADVALAGFASGSAAAMPSVVWLLVVQALSAAVALACLGEAGRDGSNRDRPRWSGLTGLIYQRPLLALALAIALLNLTGMPLTAGFVGKWNLVQLAVPNVAESLAILASSILGGVAALRSFGAIFESTTTKGEIRWSTDLVPALGAVLLLAGGLVPGQLLSVLI